MKTIIAGGRNFTDYKVLCKAMEQCGWMPSEVVSGCAHGVDKLGEKWAEERLIVIKYFSADWGAHGKFAGPIRNRQMAEYAEALVALWDGQSRGTKNMIDTAHQKGLHVYVHHI